MGAVQGQARLSSSSVASRKQRMILNENRKRSMKTYLHSQTQMKLKELPELG